MISNRLQAQLGAASLSPNALLRIETVCALVGLSKSTIYSLIARELFPSPIQLSKRCSRWSSAQIHEWLGDVATDNCK